MSVELQKLEEFKWGYTSWKTKDALWILRPDGTPLALAQLPLPLIYRYNPALIQTVVQQVIYFDHES